MKFSKIIRIAWTGLSRNKLRSLLTMLGVIIGVAAVIVMISVSAGTEASIEEQINSLGTNLIFVRSSFQRGGFGPGGGGQTGGLTFDDATAIDQNISGVEGVVVEQPSSQTVKAGNATVESVSVLGTTPDFPSVRDMTIATGRYFTQKEVDRSQKVAILGSSLAVELFGENGTPVGQVVSVGDVKMTVIGVFEDRGLVGETDYDSRIYVPITVVFDKFTPSFFARVRGDSVQLIYVETTDEANQDDVILQIELLLARRHDVTLDSPDFTVTTQQDLITTQESTTAAFRSLLAWVAAVSLIVGGIGIMNIMLVSVTERTREIGIRQSIGATPNDIRWQFLTEAMLLSLAGGLLGVLVGIAGAYLYGAYGELRTVVLPSSIILAFTSAAAVGIFFGFYPANQAARLDPIEALRHE
ncbi:MAG: ABC transporter permease [Anaerolineales bacterium]|nr:ABC transporter permease [Anaerolineales bacterium]